MEGEKTGFVGRCNKNNPKAVDSFHVNTLTRSLENYVGAAGGFSDGEHLNSS